MAYTVESADVQVQWEPLPKVLTSTAGSMLYRVTGSAGQFCAQAAATAEKVNGEADRIFSAALSDTERRTFHPLLLQPATRQPSHHGTRA